MCAATQEPLRPLTSQEEAFMRTLVKVITTLPRAIDHDMTHDRQLPLVEYLTLMHLSEAPDRRLRMSALAEAADLSVSGMTRVVARLETQGLVKRVKCVNDGRGWNAVLTDDGYARLQTAWPSHLNAVRRRLIDHFDGVDLDEYTRVLQRVAGACSSR